MRTCAISQPVSGTLHIALCSVSWRSLESAAPDRPTFQLRLGTDPLEFLLSRLDTHFLLKVDDRPHCKECGLKIEIDTDGPNGIRSSASG